MATLDASEALAGEVHLASERARRLFSDAGWNAILRAAGFMAGAEWSETRIPVRWSDGWARTQGGYQGAQWAQSHGDGTGGGRDRIPFYETGTWMKNAVRTHPVVTVTKGRLQLRVIVPVGHALKPGTADAFKRMTPADVAALSAAFRRNLVRAINGASGAARSGGISISRAAVQQGVRFKGRNVSSGVAGELHAVMVDRGAALRDQHRRAIAWNTGHRRWQLDLWRRRAGGSAGPTRSQARSGQVLSQRYLNSGKSAHRYAQHRYRTRQRLSRTFPTL